MVSKKGIKIVFRLLIVAMVLGTFIGAVQPALASANIGEQLSPNPPGFVLNTGGDIEQIWWKVTFDSTPLLIKHTIIDPFGNQFGPTEIWDHDLSASPYPDFVVQPISANETKPQIYNPEDSLGQHQGGPGFFHSFVVPAGATPGAWTSHVEYWSDAVQGAPEQSADQTFLVKQPLTIFKYNDLNGNGSFDAGEPGLDGWHFTVTGPGYSTANDTVNGGFIDLPLLGQSGNYTITETLQSGWVNTDPGNVLHQKIVDVPADFQGPTPKYDPTTDRVNFGNREVPGIHIVKLTNGTDNDSPPGLLIDPVGSQVTWTYLVTNPTDVPLSNVLVTDNMGVTPVYQSGDDGDNKLEKGETWIYSATGTAILGQYSNIGTATGTPPAGGNVSDTNPDNYHTNAPPPPGTPASSTLGIGLLIAVLAGLMTLFIYRRTRQA